MALLLKVCLAGAIGTGIRYLVGLAAIRLFGATFPWGTLAVNVVGCFFMSIVAYAAARLVISSDTRLVLGAGFMGGLTTYSAFNWETLAFLRDGAWSTGLINVAVTLAACLAAGMVGLALARAVLGS
jgi:CrcB protein